MSRNIDIAIKQFKEIVTDNRNEQHYWETRPNPNAGTLEYAQKACKHAEENEQIVAWLEELQTRREADRWISIKERMPENDEYVLVYDNSDMFVAWFSKKSGWCSFDGNFDEYTPIIAWKPLPKAPESEDK